MTSSRSYPDRPFLGVSAAILCRSHILIVQRGEPPNEGVWSLPGGAVEVGEPLDVAARREIAEETGLVFTPHRLADLVEVIRKDESGVCERHFVIAVFFAELFDETLPALAPGDDARDARWVPMDALPQITLTDGTFGVIKRVVDGAALSISSV